MDTENLLANVVFLLNKEKLSDGSRDESLFNMAYAQAAALLAIATELKRLNDIAEAEGNRQDLMENVRIYGTE